VLRLMETPGNVEVDPYADNIVPVQEGEEQYQEAVDELPQDKDWTAKPVRGRHWRQEMGKIGHPRRAQLVWTHTRSKPRGMAASPPLLDPLWAPYRESRKLAPCHLFRIRSHRLRFPRNLCL